MVQIKEEIYNSLKFIMKTMENWSGIFNSDEATQSDI